MIKFVQTTAPIKTINELHLRSFEISGNVFVALDYKKYGESNDDEQVINIRNFIKKIKSRAKDGEKLVTYLDSYGYTFTKMQIPMPMAQICIRRYLNLVEQLKDDFDFIFALDIASVDKDPKLALEANFNVMEGLKDLVIKYPELKEKLVFSHQTQSTSHYQMFSEVYENYSAHLLTGSEAIGGLVYKSASSKFSIFIGMFFRQFLNHLLVRQTNDINIHLFGIKNAADRFIATLLQHLCQMLAVKITDKPVTINVTYDTISYTKRAENIVRQEHLNQYLYKNEPKLVNEVYNTPVLMKCFEDSMETIGKRKAYPYYVDPMIIKLNIQVDELFDKIIEKQNIANNIATVLSGNPIEEQRKTSDILKDEIITNNIHLRTMIPLKFFDKIGESFHEVKPFLKWILSKDEEFWTQNPLPVKGDEKPCIINMFDTEVMYPYIRRIDAIKENISEVNKTDEALDSHDINEYIRNQKAQD